MYPQAFILMQFCQVWCLVLFISGSYLCNTERNGGVCSKRLTFVGASAVMVSETGVLVSYHCSTLMIILEMLLHFLFLFCVSVKEQATYILLSIMHTCGSPYTSVFRKTLVLPLVMFLWMYWRTAAAGKWVGEPYCRTCYYCKPFCSVKPKNLAYDRLVPVLVTDLLHNLQTRSGANVGSCTLGTKTAAPEVKWPGHEADHSPPTNAEVKNGGTISWLLIRLYCLILH
jgi:hypothetical protein